MVVPLNVLIPQCDFEELWEKSLVKLLRNQTIISINRHKSDLLEFGEGILKSMRSNQL